MKTMKNLMGLVMAAIVMGLVFASCNKDEIADHSNKEEGKAKLIIDEKPGPKPVLTDTIYGKIVNDSLIIVHDSLKNDTVFKTEQESIGFNASIKREFDERKTTVERIKKLDFSFEDAVNKQNGKMQFEGSQKGSDADAQNYTLTFASEKLSKWGLNDVHFELVGTSTPEVKNTDIEKKASDSIRIKSEMTWPLTVKVVNVPNLKDKEFKSSMLNKTNHERYISYGDAVLVKRDTTMVPTIGTWSTEWLLKVKETYRVNGQDSVAPAQTKKVTLVSKCGIDKLEDAFVGSLEFNHNFTSEKWSNWYDVESADKSVSVQERRFERLGTGSNGIAKDEFATRSFVTEQKATVVFAGLTWNIPATNATLTNVRHTFLDEASDLAGYNMIKFVDDEVASYAGTSEGDNYKKLNSSCKLYLKVATPDVDKIEFVGTKAHANGMAKIDGSITPVFTDGTKGGAISFKWEKAESWQWLKDSVIAEGVTFVNEETGNLTLKGSESKTEKTFATDNENITIKCNEYTADFQTTVKVDGSVKYTTWRAVWYEDFKVVYSGKEASLAKSSYSVKNADDKLTKDEAKSSATSEWWNYSVDGIFNIDEDSRSAMGYGRLTKFTGENGWDESTKGEEHTSLYSKRWCDFIRYKSDGTKTKQTYTHIFNNLTGGSEWNVSAEQAVETSGNVIPLAPSSENRTDDFCKFIAKKYGYEATQDYVGAVQQKDFASFTVSEDCVFEVEGKKLYFNNPEHSINSNVKTLVKESEDDTKEVYKHQRDWTFTFGGAQLNATSLGHVTIAKSDITPDFDIEVGSIYASVSRPSNRNASDITAYTYLLVSKDGKKCLPIGIYNNIVTVGEITNMQAGFNSACYVLNENKVVATACTLNNGIIKYKDANGTMVDGGMFIEWQSAGFNNRGNSYENWQHKYAPKATKKGNVTVVTFEGTNVSYTFRGWNVQ